MISKTGSLPQLAATILLRTEVFFAEEAQPGYEESAPDELVRSGWIWTLFSAAGISALWKMR
jgi:hypothetical protein